MVLCVSTDLSKVVQMENRGCNFTGAAGGFPQETWSNTLPTESFSTITSSNSSSSVQCLTNIKNKSGTTTMKVFSTKKKKEEANCLNYHTSSVYLASSGAQDISSSSLWGG